MNDIEKSDWLVLKTRSRHEKIVEKRLLQKEIPVYLPKLPALSKRPIEKPLFPGYVFVRPRPQQFYELNHIPGACGLIMQRGRPGMVQEKELRSLRAIISSSFPFEIHMGFLPGNRVQIIKGPLAGVEGELVRVKDSHRLVVLAHVLGQGVSIEIDADEIARA